MIWCVDVTTVLLKGFVSLPLSFFLNYVLKVWKKLLVMSESCECLLDFTS